ncbi:MAG: MvdC family ATP-grasp ribosomal peptide maturase [Pyrinomonadaceae bacterium]
MSLSPPVLLVTHSGDHFTVERVAEALARRGARPLRLDTDLFPEEIRLSATLAPEGAENLFVLGSDEVKLSEVRAVWARRMWPPRLSGNLDERFRAACARESAAALDAFFDGLGTARWVNDPQRERAAENKLLQLRAARESGLDIPPTLLTNDAARARAFYEAEGGRVVAKLLRPLSTSMGDAPFFLYTSDVRAEDIEALDTLRHCPVVFQRKIEKRRELRVAYVAGRTFTGALDASASARGRTDWRLAEADECSWSHAQLPPQLAAQLKSLMRRLGLVYGAIDLIETPDGRHVFLEVNPGGEWGMLEHDLDLPISGAIADALLSDE